MVSNVALNLEALCVDQHTFVVDVKLTIATVELTILNTVKSPLDNKEAVALNRHIGIITATDHRTLGPDRMNTAKSDTLS